MKFKGVDGETETCERCDKEINQLHAEGHPDYILCLTCQSEVIVEHRKSKCEICNKVMGKEPYHYNTEDTELSAHSRCVEQLSEEEREEWSDEFDY